MKRVEKLVEVKWRDAVSGTDDMEREFDDDSIEELCCVQTSYGWLAYEDKNGIILWQTYNDLGSTDYLAIPREWVLEINRLYRK